MTGRRLAPEERAIWSAVASTVKPIAGKIRPTAPSTSFVIAKPSVLQTRPLPQPHHEATSHPVSSSSNTLDANWDRRLSRGQVSPDVVIDLHGHTAATAHARLEHAIADAASQGARLLLVITGKPVRENPRLPPTRRGVIRASIDDWLAASRNASRIAAIRSAHPRHGGHGALYIILRRMR